MFGFDCALCVVCYVHVEMHHLVSHTGFSVKRRVLGYDGDNERLYVSRDRRPKERPR